MDDGRHQSVSYVSDKHGGYKAKVAYKDQHSSYTRTWSNLNTKQQILGIANIHFQKLQEFEKFNFFPLLVDSNLLNDLTDF